MTLPDIITTFEFKTRSIFCSWLTPEYYGNSTFIWNCNFWDLEGITESKTLALVTPALFFGVPSVYVQGLKEDRGGLDSYSGFFIDLKQINDSQVASIHRALSIKARIRATSGKHYEG